MCTARTQGGGVERETMGMVIKFMWKMQMSIMDHDLHMLNNLWIGFFKFDEYSYSVNTLL